MTFQVSSLGFIPLMMEGSNMVPMTMATFLLAKSRRAAVQSTCATPGGMDLSLRIMSTMKVKACLASSVFNAECF